MNQIIPNECLEFRKIKSLDNKYEINENGTILRNCATKFNIKINIDKHHSNNGYYAGFICFHGKVKRLMIHKLVAECWLGEKPEGMEIDHRDRNSLNNHYTNLRYVTHSEQMKNRVLSNKIIEQAKLNCKQWVEQVSKEIDIITPNGEWLSFVSHTACSKYLERELNIDSEKIRSNILKKRKTDYFGYRLVYNDEATNVLFIITNIDTRELFITDQIYIASHFISTLSHTKFDDIFNDIKCHKEMIATMFNIVYAGNLVGTLNRWNDAKLAEESDRVKHGLVDTEGVK